MMKWNMNEKHEGNRTHGSCYKQAHIPVSCRETGTLFIKSTVAKKVELSLGEQMWFRHVCVCEAHKLTHLDRFEASREHSV